MVLTYDIIMVSRGAHKRVHKAKAISKTTPNAQRKKPLGKPHRVWYNKGGKKAKSPAARSRGTARGSMVETFTGFQSNKQSMYHDNTNTKEGHKMKNAENYISINIKPMYNVFNSYTLDYDIRRDYITTVHGNRIEIDGGTWYLWCDSYLITSGNTCDLHAVKNVPHHDSDGLWNDIEFEYTPVREL